MARLVAIADDLTGAADCAGACATHGMATTVLLHGSAHPDMDSRWPEAEVVSIDTNTRGDSAEQAAETTEALAGMALARSPEAILFKKVDSTLRGNLAAELAAVIRAYRGGLSNRARAVILAPALPAQGRTTVGGRQMVHGRLLEDAGVWGAEPRLPRSNISEALGEGGLSSCIVNLLTVRTDVRALKDTLGALASGADVLICDAETEDDLRRIARAAIEGEFFLWAGSAGLAAQFPHALGLRKRDIGGAAPAFPAGPTLMVVGSAASVSRAQASAVAAADSQIVTVRISCDIRIDVQKAEIVASLKRGRDTLVILDEAEGGDAAMFAETLSQIVKPCADLLGGLIATGGETARAILDELGIDRLRVIGEVEPGLPFSVSEGLRRPLPVVTKAGAFGSPDALVRCREFLGRLKRTSTTETQSLLLPQES